MAFIVLHNNDSQGSRANQAFGGGANAIVQIQFAGGHIHPTSVQAVRQVAVQFPGTNVVVWMGHGKEGKHNPGRRGHPLTSAAVEIDSGELIDLFAMLNPKRLYLFTCMGMRWVQRVAHLFYSRMTFLDDSRVRIFAVTASILGGALMPVAQGLLAGNENPPGPFGAAHLFEEVALYGETFLEWRQRVSPQTSMSGANEAPF
jgi:hypothetical protein